MHGSYTEIAMRAYVGYLIDMVSIPLISTPFYIFPLNRCSSINFILEDKVWLREHLKRCFSFLSCSMMNL
jgi:hypothetical protein